RARRRGSLVRNALGDGDLDEQLGRVQHDLHRGPRRLVRGEVLAVLLVVGRQILALRQVRRDGQHIVERGARRLEDNLDSLEHVPGLLADVRAPLSGGRMPAGGGGTYTARTRPSWPGSAPPSRPSGCT